MTWLLADTGVVDLQQLFYTFADGNQYILNCVTEGDSRMRQLVGHHVLIVALSSAVLMVSLGGARLWDRDEPRNAGCAAEMLMRSDWVVPVFNGELRTAKPVLLYWLIMSSYAVFGVNEFAARFPSALLGVLTVLATYHLGKRLFHPQVGLWSALLLTSSLMFNVASRAATPDSSLICFNTLALLVFAYVSFPQIPAKRSWIVLMYGLMGVAVLAKGPVGVVLPMAVIGMFLLIDRLPSSTSLLESEPRNSKSPAARLIGLLAMWLRPFAPGHFFRTLWVMWPLTAIIVVLAVCLPWYGWVHYRTDGRWVREFLWVENLGRAVAPMENHGGTPVFYLVTLLAGFFPASVFIGAMLTNAVRAIRRRDTWSQAYIFLFCWIGVYVFIFTVSQTKLPSYVTPTHPALALLAGSFFYQWTRGEFELSRWRGRVSMACLGAVGIGLAVTVYFAAQRFLPDERWLWTVGLILPVGATVCLACLETRRRRMAAFVFVTTGMLFCVMLFGYAAVRVGRYQNIDHLLQIRNLRSREPQLASFRCLEPSWVYYSGQTIHEFGHDSLGALQYLQADTDNLLITTDRYWADLQADFSDEIHVLAEVPYFLKKDRIVLLGRNERTTDRVSDRRAMRSKGWK